MAEAVTTALPGSLLGLFSPRPHAAAHSRQTTQAPALSPELLLAVAQTERDSLRALLAAQAEAQAALEFAHESGECTV